MKQNQKEVLLTSFIISHFGYCLLIWMFCSKKSTKKINAAHERSLQQVSIDIREAASLSPFKNLIKTWKCEDCSCRSCKIFIQNSEYI